MVCWKWSTPGYRSAFSVETVLTLRDMVRRHYPEPHRFVCVTDDPAGLGGVEVIADTKDFADVRSPHGGHNPSCYRRLRMFRPDAEQWFGQRFVSIDLDVVITGDLRPLFHRSEDVVFWGDTNPLPRSHYNGSLMLLTAGSRPQVWTSFDPERSPRLSLKAQCWGSDQGWISYVLGNSEAKFTKADGVYSFRNDLKEGSRSLPADAKVVFFHGAHDPWGQRAQSLAWVRRHYAREAVAA